MCDTSLAKKTLYGRTVLVACSPKKMSELVAGIEAMGGQPLPFPVIETREIEDKDLLDHALASLNQYAWVIFTSAYGVHFFLKRLRELGIKPEAQTMPKICAIGPATADSIRESGLPVELIPEKFVAEGVVESLGKYYGGLQALAGHRVLLPRAKEARELLPEALLRAGVLLDVVPCYQTIRAAPDDELLGKLREMNPDLILFTSSSGIRHLIDLLGENAGKLLLAGSATAVIGPITRRTVESFGKKVEIIPRENTIVSLLEAIREYYSCRHATAADPR